MIDLHKKVKKGPGAIAGSQDDYSMQTSHRLLASTQNLYSSSNSTVKVMGSLSVSNSTNKLFPFVTSLKDLEN
jgi:hypothetical protein